VERASLAGDAVGAAAEVLVKADKGQRKAGQQMA
jgi:hypothetical protein